MNKLAATLNYLALDPTHAHARKQHFVPCSYTLSGKPKFIKRLVKLLSKCLKATTKVHFLSPEISSICDDFIMIQCQVQCSENNCGFVKSVVPSLPAIATASDHRSTVLYEIRILAIYLNFKFCLWKAWQVSYQLSSVIPSQDLKIQHGEELQNKDAEIRSLREEPLKRTDRPKKVWKECLCEQLYLHQ